VGLTLLTSVLMIAYVLRIFEIPYDHTVGQIDFYDYFNSVWCVVITITTVGYGDIVAASVFGQVITMFTALWGNFLISLLIVSVGEVFALNRNEKRAMHHLRLTRKAAISITAALRFYIAKKKYKEVMNRETVIYGDDTMKSEIMVNERIEDDDLRRLRVKMQTRLGQFRDEWNELKQLSLQVEAEQEQMMYLIKHEVIDLADRFDSLEL